MPKADLSFLPCRPCSKAAKSNDQCDYGQSIMSNAVLIFLMAATVSVAQTLPPETPTSPSAPEFFTDSLNRTCESINVKVVREIRRDDKIPSNYVLHFEPSNSNTADTYSYYVDPGERSMLKPGLKVCGFDKPLAIPDPPPPLTPPAPLPEQKPLSDPVGGLCYAEDFREIYGLKQDRTRPNKYYAYFKRDNSVEVYIRMIFTNPKTQKKLKPGLLICAEEYTDGTLVRPDVLEH